MEFEKMEISLHITKTDKGLEITGTVKPQDSSEDKSEKSETEAPDACGQNQPAANEELTYDYKVISVKPSGKSSLLLEIADKNGDVTAAYIKVGTQPIAVGSCLTEVDVQEKTGAYGNYNLINTCKIAA